MKRFRIERVDVDMPGVAPGDARAAARDLAPAIRRQIAQSGLVTTRTTTAEASRGNGLADHVARQVAGKIEATSGLPADSKASRS